METGNRKDMGDPKPVIGEPRLAVQILPVPGQKRGRKAGFFSACGNRPSFLITRNRLSGRRV